MLDLSVSVGNLLQIIAMLLGGLFFLYRMEARLIVLATVQDSFVARVTAIDKELTTKIEQKRLHDFNLTAFDI